MPLIQTERVPDPVFEWEPQAQARPAGVPDAQSAVEEPAGLLQAQSAFPSAAPADRSVTPSTAENIQLQFHQPELDTSDATPDEGTHARSAAKKATHATVASHCSKAAKHKKIHYANLDLEEEEREQLRKLDADGDGEISLSEVIDLIRKEKTELAQMNTMFKTGLGIVLILLALLGANTVATFAVVELSKENHVEGASLVSASTGETIQVSSSDMVISSSGALTSRQANARLLAECSSTGTCAANNATEKPIAVVENQVQRKMSSVIPSKILAELKRIKLSSKDKVSEFYLSIHSMMRVVTPGSRCGTVVKFFTHVGVVTFDDAVISVDAQAEGVLKEAGFDLAQGGVVGYNGRRLSEDVDAAGYFSFFENFDWKCDSLAAPKFFIKPYQVTVSQNHPCTSSKCISAFKDKQGNKLQKPGYLKKEAALVSKFESIITNTHSVKLIKYPNHPSQTFVEITDVKNATKYSFQMDTDGKAWHCSDRKKFNSTKEDFDISKKYTPVFNGYNAAHEGTSLREFLLVPIDAEKTPFVVKYVDDAKTLLPHAVSFPQARQFEMNMESAKVEKYTKLTASRADLLAKTYLDKKCMSTEQMKQQKIAPPTKIMGNPYKEDLKAVLGHLDKLDDELVPDDTKPFPFTAAATKYGNYWASLGELYFKDSNFYKKQGLGAAPSAPPRANASRSSGGRRMGLCNYSVMGAVCGALPSEFSMPLSTGCSVGIAYDGEDGLCLEASADDSCGKDPPGFYASGSLKGCSNLSQGNIAGSFCLGYAWGISKSFDVNIGWWSKTINIDCGVNVEGCLSVEGAYHEQKKPEGSRRRKQKLPPAYGVTVGMSAAFGGSCLDVISVSGEMGVAAGPCGKGLDMRGSAGLEIEGCLTWGPFSSCFELGNIDIVKELDLPDCR